MKLIVKQSSGEVQELLFQAGPISIGRQMGSHVFLPDTAVSRQHAVINLLQDGHSWVVEDLDSANKTYINGSAVHKAQINNGDTIKIAGFTIEVSLSPESSIHEPAEAVHKDDTIVTVRHEVSTVVRHADVREKTEVKLPASRVKDFSWAVMELHKAACSACRTGQLKQFHRLVLDIILRQFVAHQAWAGFRKETQGPLDYQGGITITSQTVKRSDLLVQQTLADAMEKHTYVLVPQIPRQMCDGKISSVIIAPIIREGKCYGALYSDNSTEQEHYAMQDLDYLMLLAIHIGVVLEKL